MSALDLLPASARNRVPAPVVARGRILAQPGSGCTSAKHGPSNGAWRNGCRCPMAVAAHDQHLAALRATRQAARRHWERTGECIARIHRTEKARQAGCMCPRPDGPRPIMTPAMKARYRTLRGPNMQVNPIALDLLLAGYPDRPTLAERTLAVVILSRRGNRAGTGLLTNAEIAERLHMTEGPVRVALARHAEWRGHRTERRWLDNRAKAVRVAKAKRRRNHG